MVRRLAKQEAPALTFGLHGHVCYGCKWLELLVSGRTSCHFSYEAELEWRRRTSLPGENVSPSLFRQTSSAFPRWPLPAPLLRLIAATPCPPANLIVCRQKTTQKIQQLSFQTCRHGHLAFALPSTAFPATPSSPSQNPVMCFFAIISSDFWHLCPCESQLENMTLTGEEAFLVLDCLLAAGNISFQLLCYLVPLSSFTVHRG